jgi:hypothetical protein
MIEEMGSGSNYRISIDKTKNRLYILVLGEAMTSSGVQGLVPAVKAGCAALKPGFTAVADFLEMTLLGLPDVVRDVQETIMAAGLRKLASVWHKETFAKMVVDQSAQKAAGGSLAEKRRVFHSRDEAEAWLDD